jgi:ammonia channel protein AmtB
MQAGFSLMETGLVRSKNATNILMKSTLDACEFCFIHDIPVSCLRYLYSIFLFL